MKNARKQNEAATKMVETSGENQAGFELRLLRDLVQEYRVKIASQKAKIKELQANKASDAQSPQVMPSKKNSRASGSKFALKQSMPKARMPKAHVSNPKTKPYTQRQAPKKISKVFKKAATTVRETRLSSATKSRLESGLSKENIAS